MIFDNLEVKHKSFGDGLVISNNGKYMTVKFATTQKTFVYPDAFENFLTLAAAVDIGVVKEVDAVVEGCTDK